MLKKNKSLQSKKVFKQQNSVTQNNLVSKIFHSFLKSINKNESFRTKQRKTKLDWIDFRHRLLVFIFLIGIALILFIRFGLFTCHFFNHSEYCNTREIELVKNASLSEKDLYYATPRNNILDRNGNILAMDLKKYYLAIYPKKIYSHLHSTQECQISLFYQTIKNYLDEKHALPRLSKQALLEFQSEKGFKDYIKKNKDIRYQRLAELSINERDQLQKKMTALMKKNGLSKRNNDCQFIDLSLSFYKRTYPEGSSLSGLLGYVSLHESAQKKNKKINNKINETPTGQKGIEKLFEEQLAIYPSAQRIVRSLKTGQVVKVDEYDSNLSAENPLILSIDVRAQRIIFNELKKRINHFNASKGGAILIDGKNGEVLALASYPSFDPAKQEEMANAKLQFNHVYQGWITPGSTLKPFVLAAAYEKNVIDDSFQVDTENEKIISHGKLVEDSTDNGILDADGVVIHSSNIGIIKMIRMIEKKDFASYLFNLKIANEKALNLPGETKGFLKERQQWLSGYYDYLATGYSLNTSLSHIVRAYSVFANDGKIVELSLLKKKANEPVIKSKVFEEQTIRRILPVLKKVLEEGTGTKAQIEGYEAYGKTGTSQILIDVPTIVKGEIKIKKRYTNNKHQAIFIGLVPSRKHDYIMGVYIDDPKGSDYYGGSVAGLLFARSMQQILQNN